MFLLIFNIVASCNICILWQQEVQEEDSSLLMPPSTWRPPSDMTTPASYSTPVKSMHCIIGRSDIALFYNFRKRALLYNATDQVYFLSTFFKNRRTWTHAKNLRELKNDFFCQICKYLFLLQTTIAKISKFGFGLVEGAKLKSNISKLNFGIGVKKQCGTTCRVPNILFSKITPP